MKRTDAVRLARQLMKAHGVGDASFKFNRHKTRFGVCRWTRYGVQIELSEVLLPHRTEENIRDTILHEIAHAIAGHAAGHGPKWKAVASRIGARPKRCGERLSEAVLDKTQKYRAECRQCGERYHFNRMGRKWKAGTYRCGKCHGRFKVTQLR